MQDFVDKYMLNMKYWHYIDVRYLLRCIFQFNLKSKQLCQLLIALIENSKKSEYISE